MGTKRGSTEELEAPKLNRNKSMDERSSEDLSRFQPDILVLTGAGKSAQNLLDEIATLKRQSEETQKVITAARKTFDKVREAKPPQRKDKDVATRQELKSRIDDLEKDLRKEKYTTYQSINQSINRSELPKKPTLSVISQVILLTNEAFSDSHTLLFVESSILVAEQESTSAQRLFSEVEEMRCKIQREVPDLPISDEIKDCRLKLLAAEQQIDSLCTEIKDLQNNLTEERRRTRSVSFWPPGGAVQRKMWPLTTRTLTFTFCFISMIS